MVVLKLVLSMIQQCAKFFMLDISFTEGQVYITVSSVSDRFVHIHRMLQRSQIDHRQC